MFPRASSRARRLTAIVPALGLAAAGLAAIPAGAADATAANWVPSASDHYINYAPPMIQDDVAAADTERLGREAKDATALTGQDIAKEVDRKYASGNPGAARILARNEREALRTGKNPFEFIYKKAKTKQTAKLLTLLVEFNENANDDFSGFSRQKSTAEPNTCVVEPPGTKLNGPLHNKIPNPATLPGPGKDNNSMWVDDFSADHFNKMLYSTTGITKRVRPDLTDPRDGKKGIDISGSTMKNMYEEMSKGAYSVSGQAVGWIKAPHSEAWYGAAACVAGEDNAPQNTNGHPDNPLGAAALAVDAINALAAQQPNFPWADYDLEDISDADGDGNLLEPDGVIDHLVLVHAGKDKSGGGGAEGTYAIWAHASTITGGYTIPGTNKKIANYIVQPEDSGVGVFAHEYGHDLGLPDLYDVTGAGDTSVEFWSLMSTGSHSGPIFQSLPAHIDLWGKWVLGWANPKTLNMGDGTKTITVGQSSNTPKFTEDGVRINLPDKSTELTVPHSGGNAWWTGSDQNWADSKITRTVPVPAGSDVKFWMWNDYVIEDEWDYGFVEVSTDGGATWHEQKVYDESGTLVSTDDGYGDPNKRLKDYGDKKYGLTGTTEGWRHDYVDLTPFAGQTVQLRLRYATDAAFMERGWFADDFAVTAAGATVWSDDVESGANGWTATTGTFTDSKGQGWKIHSGTEITDQFYLAEWRNLDGFDKGLAYTYDTNYQRDGVWNVEKIKYNAPGLLVWLRDASYYEQNNPALHTAELPSYGSKGGLLLVDSHFDPLRRTGVAATKDPSTSKNIPMRPQASNGAFGFNKTYPFKECLEAAGEPYSMYCTNFPAQDPVKEFTDAKTWYPGFEWRGGTSFINRSRDASAVVPAKDNQPYGVRVVKPDGTPATEVYGSQLLGFTLGTGNPGDEGKALGAKIKLITPLPLNLGVILQVTAPKK
ncbi:immune inhibitor A domain-containing protein [Acrocarpospora catenulata]|uniref:immune inhibitor A domain-containing protein n=1 Tax=Acrocarpospora catenulata TaxID=2836182 RepID=UPI001BDB46B6|nr:immune inhibitor A domain-containing protein [Acrocarpospora catenulata]